MKKDDLQSELTAYCTSAFPDKEALTIDEPTNISNGWETEIYAFDLEHGPPGDRQSEELILRLYPDESAQATATREFRAMIRLFESGYPVPRILAQESEASPLDKPFILMERIDGQLMWSLLSVSPEEEQDKLISIFCELFVQLHRLDWTPFTEDIAGYNRGGPYIFVDKMLGEAEGALKRFKQYGYLPALAWIKDRRDMASCLRPSIVHWDFHPNNILVRDDGTAIVIDWSGLDISDYRFDLAWTLLLADAYSGDALRNQILSEYERQAGVAADQLTIFEVYACLRRLFSVTVSLSAGPEKLGMDPAAKALMQEQMAAHQRVYDLFLKRTGIRIREVEALF